MTRSDLYPSGRTWLITERTAPAWQAVLTQLERDVWHPTADVQHTMREAADLADRTIENHLKAASRRGWINRSRGLVRVINPDLIRADLEALR